VTTWQAPDAPPPAPEDPSPKPPATGTDPAVRHDVWTGPGWTGRARHAAPRQRPNGWAVAGVVLSLTSLGFSLVALAVLST
jgi:hypothetical protein